MPSAIILSTHPSSASEVEHAVSACGVRVRVVASAKSAYEWISMSTQELVLVDARVGYRETLELFSKTWKLSPLTVCAVYSTESEIDFRWEATLVGALVILPPNIIQKIRTLSEGLASRNRDSQHFPILLVEDLDSPRNVIASFIESIGYAPVVSVDSGVAALKALEERSDYYSCVVTDFNMPNMNGAEVIESIRGNPSLRHLPVVVLTAYSTVSHFIECLKAGATGFVVKPPSKKTLRFELEKARRILFSGRSPRLCQPDEAELLEQAILKMYGGA